MSAKAQVSDDLIHTMSKKIAQLTKVIYLLNTKSDEHDYETKCIRESHENDVKDVLEDAHSKMVKFQRDLISSSDAQDVKAREIIQQLERKNAEEKKNALEQLRQVKQKASDNERILKEASQNEIAGIRKEVEDVKAEFHKRLEAFSKLQKTIEANASSGSEALKKAHADEIAELVRKSNAKYNQMFNERMEAEEDLKEQLEALRAQLKESAAAEKVKKEYEAKIAKQAAELDQKMKDALRAQKEKFDEAMAERHHDAKTMNKLQAELDSVRTQLAASKEELKNSRSNFDAKEKELKAAAEEANNSKMLMVKQIQRMEVSIQGLRAEIEHLTSQLEQRDNAASKLGGDLASQQKEREAQAALLADARRQLEESKKRCEALESELDELKKRDAANVEKNKATAKKLAEREADVKRLTDDNKRLRDAASQDSAAKDAASQELAKQLDEIQKKYKKVGAKAKEYKALNETQKTELEMLKEACANHERAAEVSVGDLAKARSEADALRVELRRIKEQLEAREVELKNLSSSLQLEGANGREAQQAASRALADAEARCAELTRQLKAANEKAVKDARTLEQLRAEAAEISAKVAQNDARLNARITTLTDQLSALETETAALRTANIDLAAQLKNALAFGEGSTRELEQRLRDSERGRERAEAELKSLQRELEVADRERDANAKASERARREAEEASRRALRELANEWEAKMRAEREENAQQALLLSQANSSTSDELARARSEAERRQKELAAREEALAAAARRHAQELERVQTQARAEAAEAAVRFEAELARITKQLEERVQAEVAARKESAARAAAEMARVQTELRASKDKELAELVQKHERTLSDEKTQAASRLAETKAQLEERLSSLERQATATAASLRGQLEESSAETQRLKAALEASSASASRLQSSLTALERASSLAAQSHMHELDELKREAAARLGEAERDAEERLARNKDELRKKHALEVEALNNRLAVGSRAYEDLRLRWEQRESRPEDVATIQSLSQRLKEAEQLARSAVEDMQFYKLELVNREENYNKTFGRKPNVAGPVAPSQRGSENKKVPRERSNPAPSTRGESPAPSTTAGTIRSQQMSARDSGSGSLNNLKYFGN